MVKSKRLFIYHIYLLAMYVFIFDPVYVIAVGSSCCQRKLNP